MLGAGLKSMSHKVYIESFTADRIFTAYSLPHHMRGGKVMAVEGLVEKLLVALKVKNELKVKGV